MDSYIDTIRTNKPKGQITSKKTDQEEERVPKGVNASSIYIIKKPKTFWEKIVETFTGTEEEDFESRKSKKPAEDEDEFEEESEQLEQEEKKKGLWHRFTQLFATNVNEAYSDIDEVEQIEHKQENQQKKAVTQEKKDQDIYAEEQKKSVWENILQFFGMSAEEEGDEDPEGEQIEQMKRDAEIEKLVEMKEDLKQIAIIATATFKKLPKEQFEMFKKSSDFAQFKKILSKHNIIKQKEA